MAGTAALGSGMVRQALQSLQQRLKQLRPNRGHAAEPQTAWDYKVVQLVSQVPPSPEDASRKLGGSISADALRSQFPESYASQNGRHQLNEFLNLLGDDGWELVQIQQIVDLPLMVFKRPRRQPPPEPLDTEPASPAEPTP